MGTFKQDAPVKCDGEVAGVVLGGEDHPGELLGQGREKDLGCHICVGFNLAAEK